MGTVREIPDASPSGYFVTRKNDGRYPQFYVEENHPPIIDHDTFEAVEVMRQSRRKNARTGPVQKHIFTSVLTCGCCGEKLTRQKNKSGNVFWICREHRKKADACPLPPIPEESIRQAFLEQMELLHKNDTSLRVFKNALTVEWRCRHGEKLTALENRRDDLQKKFSALEGARSQMGDYLAKRNRVRQELLETEAVLQSVKEKRIDITEELLQSVHGWDSSFSFDEDIFHRLVEGVTVNGKDEFIFRFHCGFEAGAAEEENRKTA